MSYRGRIAPTPTGLLHLGHAATFYCAFFRAQAANGGVILRIEDLDPNRCHSEFADAAMEDLRWLGISWDEGPDIGGKFAPYRQSERKKNYREIWKKLRDAGAIYPSAHSRKDVASAANAPHDDDDSEPIFPPEWRPQKNDTGAIFSQDEPAGINWRFRVPDGEHIEFFDEIRGAQSFTAGVDFGDFLVWRRDDVPAYELAVVADDAAMEISEVVRGEDLLKSTARQILLYRALGMTPPLWAHTPLIRDKNGRRLAKRNAELGIRALRERNFSPRAIREIACFQGGPFSRQS